jgi:8-oxo-dGTP diphosphatase
MKSLDATREEVFKLYGNRLRTRVCGICIVDNRLLMVRHKGIGPTDTFWCPPGGGIQFGENALEALQREFLEETGLVVEPEELLFVNEFMEPPLHAMELFFRTRVVSGELRLGMDPEMSDSNQIIYEVKLMTMEEIKSFPEKEVHYLFRYCETMEDIFNLKGYLQH